MLFSQVVKCLTANAKVATCNSSEFDTSIHRHIEIWDAVDEAVVNKVHQKIQKVPFLIFLNIPTEIKLGKAKLKSNTFF
jgi:hypothetical protein